MIVIDNQSLGNTRLGTKNIFNGRTFGNEKKYGYYPPDVKKICGGFNIKYFSLTKDSDIKKKVNYFLNTHKNAILHVKVLSEYDVVDHTQKLLQSNYKISKDYS